MKKFIAALFASFMLLGLFGFVSSASAEPGPNGNNDKGLCTAYYNGQKKGHDKKNNDPGPFQALEDAAANSDGVNQDGDDETDEGDETIDDSDGPGSEGDLEQAEAVANFCEGLIGGNPEHGRYTCIAGDEDEDGNGYDCTRNEEPGNADDK